MHISKRLVALLCIIVVSVGGVVFATVSLTNTILAKTHVIETGESAADNVTVYGNGVTFISYEETVKLDEDTDAVHFYLPSGALTDTLTVTGINVAKITTNEERHPIIERGDIIAVYTEDAAYTGKFLGWDDMLLLEVNNGTVMIPGTRITRIVLTEVVQTQGPRILVKIATDSPPGEHKLKISYLMRGPKWKPTYFIDLEASYLECWATIENVENWNNFTLTLVAGGPHIVYGGPIIQPYYGMEGLYLSPSIDFSSTTIDEYHEYTYGGELTFDKGTIVKLALFNGSVSLRQEYFWSSGEVQNRYHINNTLSEPLAAGTVEFYRGERWMGEDSIGYTPTKEESVAIANYAYDIKVTQTVTKSVTEYRHEVRGITITIQNRKTVKVQILVQQDISGCTLVTSAPPATIVGSTLTWLVEVDADGAAEVYYEHERYW